MKITEFELLQEEQRRKVKEELTNQSVLFLSLSFLFFSLSFVVLLFLSLNVSLVFLLVFNHEALQEEQGRKVKEELRNQSAISILLCLSFLFFSLPLCLKTFPRVPVSDCFIPFYLFPIPDTLVSLLQFVCTFSSVVSDLFL